MRSIFLVLGLLIVGFPVHSQSQLSEGDILIEPYVGIPNWKNLFKYSADSATIEEFPDYKINGTLLGFGARVEYLFFNNLGFGLDVNYVVSGYRYSYVSSVYNETTMEYADVLYKQDYKEKRLRGLFRMNYHFVQSDHVDFYTGLGLGFKTGKSSLVTNDPNISTSQVPIVSFPISFRMAIGAHIYFTKNLGLHFEFGLFGGGLIQTGIAFKIPTV